MRNRLKIRFWKADNLPADWFERTQKTHQETKQSIESKVKAIIDQVKKDGDNGLVKLTREFDKVDLLAKDLRVTPEEVQKAYKRVTKEEVAALRLMKKKVSSHEKTWINRLDTYTSQKGLTVENRLVPIESVGCYIPGGRAAYPSTVIMTATPAKVAGVPRIVACSPPNEEGNVNPLVLVAADICRIDEIYKIGGAQAIAALAYGTATIKPVRKIVGPGSKYVTMAKVIISKEVAIDMPAGPSEVLVLADETANPRFVAADLVSQAEHGADSVAGLITTSAPFAERVCEWLTMFARSANRNEVIEKALTNYGFMIICESKDEMISLSNIFAPEHLEIMVEDAKDIADRITSAGLVLLGSYAPVSLSDYGSGSNHVLPTEGFAHSFSGLSALDFYKRICIVDCSKQALATLRSHIKILANAENLPSHYKAIEVRLEDDK